MATLVSGIVPAVPLTVILGPVALARINRTRARGRSLVITGLVLAGLWTIAAAIGGAVFLTRQHQPPGPPRCPGCSACAPGSASIPGGTGSAA